MNSRREFLVGLAGTTVAMARARAFAAGPPTFMYVGSFTSKDGAAARGSASTAGRVSRTTGRWFNS